MSEQLIMAVRGHGETQEAEPVIVGFHDGQVVLELDDGDSLELDFRELVNAVAEQDRAA